MLQLGQRPFCGRRWHYICYPNTKEFCWRAFSWSSTAAPKDVPLVVARQIERAKAQFNETHQKQYPDITASLEKGIVKPFFHTLLLPDPFLESHRRFDKVTAGGVREIYDVELDEMGGNLDDVIDASSWGARSISDDGMGIGSKWKFSPFQTAFAVDLVNTDAKMLGEGIERTDLVYLPSKLTFRSSGGSKSNKVLLTRPESRGVVAESFHRFMTTKDEGSVSAITGSPGIGKSWTLFYALQQALHYDGAKVLFFFQKTNDAVLYLRRNNKIYAWKSKSKGAADSALFNRSDVLVLLDPKEAYHQGGANFVLGDIKLLYAASNNENHFKAAAEKEFGKIQAYLGPPLDRELFVILAQLDPDLKPSVIQERKENVGNLMRYILNKEKYDLRIKSTVKAVNECAKDKHMLEKALANEGMSDAHNTIPGTLFKVLPSRPTPLTEIGYDGQNVQYRVRVVEAVNSNVRDSILKAGSRNGFVVLLVHIS